MKEKSSPSQLAPTALATSMQLFPENSSSELPSGSLNDDLMVRGIVTDAIKHSGKSRDQIADEMSRLLGLPVTARMITSFTAESKEMHRWPGAWDRAFCAATGNYRLLWCRVEAAGYQVISRAEAELMEIGRQYLINKRSEQSIALLEKRLQGVEL